MATRSKRTTPKTTTAKKTTVKTTKAKVATTAKKPSVKAAASTPAVATPEATVVEALKPVVSGAPVKKPELIERVMAETGMKKKDVKPVVEAMLTVLGQALSNNEELAIPPLGKVRVNRMKDLANSKIINIKVRHPMHGQTAPKDPLAQAAE